MSEAFNFKSKSNVDVKNTTRLSLGISIKKIADENKEILISNSKYKVTIFRLEVISSGINTNKRKKYSTLENIIKNCYILPKLGSENIPFLFIEKRFFCKLKYINNKYQNFNE